MTDAVKIALVTAIPPTIVALAGLVVSLRNSRKADRIHVLVNSNLETVKRDLAGARAKITFLTAALK